jgi:1-deoxy-D-xylulose-5-phosphate synthase
MRFAKPLDEALIRTIAAHTKKIVTIEENTCIGGLFGAVSEIVAGSGVSVCPIALPDAFVEHGSQNILRDKYCLSAQSMAEHIRQWL